MTSRLTILIGISCGLPVLLSMPAEAKIACNKGFQRVQGSWLATPYCQDDYVAAVAREYGFSASAEAVRNNPMFKQRLCRFIGQDIRIKESCDEANANQRGRF